jgi:hypothetical protein
MDDHLLEILENMIEGRNDFFIRTMQLTPHQSRPQILSRYMLNEVCILELLNRVYQNNINNPNSATVTFTIPRNFSDPVIVAPSQAQITAALEDITTSTNNCSICQDVISSGGCAIRHCRHEFHRSCLTNWFGVSVRCPVCRHDIRETVNPANETTQTPSDEE